MTPHSTVQSQPGFSAYHPPGTVVYDVVAGAVGRVANPAAYPPGCPDRPCVLVVPLVGSDPAWQAEPGALREAAAEEIEAVLTEATAR
ncbi:hypothetical protein ACIQU6_18160 [Streptomyces sp. NPDC090442]|uniref:hypothetical protein n=1 Tax=Streptomyces sp. NPDC090442 TaxID=3365962 RepID=UPI0037FD67A7